MSVDNDPKHSPPMASQLMRTAPPVERRPTYRHI